jgi:hypothetical protein
MPQPHLAHPYHVFSNAAQAHIRYDAMRLLLERPETWLEEYPALLRWKEACAVPRAPHEPPWTRGFP